MTIVLQLKSTQRKADLEDISNIIDTIQRQHGYKIRGHEIQQVASVMGNTTLGERVEMIANFCSKNEIEYLTYHAPIFEPEGDNLGERRRRMIEGSILQTVEEAETVCSRSGIREDAVIVFHLTYYVSRAALPITKEEKLKLQSRSEEAFLQFYEREGLGGRKGIVMALENSYPKYYPGFATAGPYHPSDIAGLQEHGIKSVLDLSHYQLYANYVRNGSGNQLGDLDREIHGQPPSWEECMGILSNSLVQLHISDAKGFDPTGEGLKLGQGEIPIRQVLQSVHDLKRLVRGTVELDNGHLNHSQSQLEAARWIINNSREVL
ncbi:MAG: hypothetical protein HRF40_05160 [Nitrososphaera sp.]|jgi:hypothetical protein